MERRAAGHSMCFMRKLARLLVHAVNTAALLVGAVFGVGCDGGVAPSPPSVPPGPSTRLSIEGERLRRFRPGDTLTLRVLRRDVATGTLIEAVPVSDWWSSDSAVATIDRAGRVVAHGPGYARLRMRASDEVDSVWAQVQASVLPAKLFTFEFDPAISEPYRRAAMTAAHRWSMIIPEALPAIDFDAGTLPCGPQGLWTRPIAGRETGIRILVAQHAIEAPAGSYLCQRRAGGLGALALIVFSPDPLYRGYSEEQLAVIWFHELGHALGLVADLIIAPGQALRSPAMLAGFLHDFGRAPDLLSHDRNAHWVGVPGDIMDGSTGTRATTVSRVTLGRLLDMGYPVALRQSGPLDLGALRP